jgi:hypothetical protein
MKLSDKLKRRIVIAVTSEQYGKELIDAIESEDIQTGTTVIAGVALLPDASSTFTVTFPTPLSSSNYSIVISISNTVDVSTRHLNPTITGKTTNSFSFKTAQTTDHPNYFVNYQIVML